jgi:hypothetical protein
LCTNSIILCFIVISFHEGKGSKMPWVCLAYEDEFKSICADIGCKIMAILIDDSVKMTIDTIENRG